jgi:hypothetical protein
LRISTTPREERGEVKSPRILSAKPGIRAGFSGTRAAFCRYRVAIKFVLFSMRATIGIFTLSAKV